MKCDNSLDKLQIVVTSSGYRVVGWENSLLPLGRLARIKYKKKLRTRRALKKYAKKLLQDALDNHLKEAYAEQKKDG